MKSSLSPIQTVIALRVYDGVIKDSITELES